MDGFAEPGPSAGHEGIDRKARSGGPGNGSGPPGLPAGGRKHRYELGRALGKGLQMRTRIRRVIWALTITVAAAMPIAMAPCDSPLQYPPYYTEPIWGVAIAQPE